MKRSEITFQTLQKILFSANSEGFVTNNAAKHGIEHSKGYLFSKENSSFLETLKKEDLAIDLGTGGGLPGLVLATFTDCYWLLVDRSDRRCAFLKKAIFELDLNQRVEVIECSAEELSQGDYRGKAKLVTARSFGSPAITAECASPLLKEDGLFIVSEPPLDKLDSNQDRWPVDGLTFLGLKQKENWHTGLAGYRSFFCAVKCPEIYPRRFNKILKKPVF
jgi:16S rRNA (guanine527-N7)-methyltransferase